MAAHLEVIWIVELSVEVMELEENSKGRFIFRPTHVFVRVLPGEVDELDFVGRTVDAERLALFQHCLRGIDVGVQHLRNCGHVNKRYRVT